MSKDGQRRENITVNLYPNEQTKEFPNPLDRVSDLRVILKGLVTAGFTISLVYDGGSVTGPESIVRAYQKGDIYGSVEIVFIPRGNRSPMSRGVNLALDEIREYLS